MVKESYACILMPHLFAVNFHDRRPSSISTSNISHVTENRNWFGVNGECNQLTHFRPVEYKSVYHHVTDLYK